MANQPSQIHQEFAQYFNARDIDSLLALYDPDALVAAEPGRLVAGTGAIRGFLTPFIESGLHMTMSTVYVMEKDGVALVSAEWTLSGGPEVLRGKTSEVLRRTPAGDWRLMIDNPWSA